MLDKSTKDGIPPGFTLRRRLQGHGDVVTRIAWSPDGQILAAPSKDWTIRLWDVQNGRILQTLQGHSDRVNSLAWSPDGRMLASGSGDKTIRLWDPNSGQATGILEGHTGAVSSVSFFYDGRLLASKSVDGTVRIWRTDAWETMATLKEYSLEDLAASLDFHPNASILATTTGKRGTVIHIWDLNIATLLGISPTTPSVHYTNARVVLVGDSGVGKSGLGLVLTGQPFVPTESTHGRNVWNFDNREVDLDSMRKEKRETLLWDLAGQPGYRLIHQLHLSEVALALVVFDSHSETDPFAGVRHWVRALRLAERVQGNATLRMKKFLVAARIDRGGKSGTCCRR